MAAEKTELLGYARDIAIAQLTANPRPDSEIPGLIEIIYVALHRLMNLSVVTSDGKELVALNPPRVPAVPIEESITHDHLVCLEDGRKLQMMKRYLQTRYHLTPEMYRKRWGLPSDYPMSAPCVTAQRRALAKENRLGGKIERKR